MATKIVILGVGGNCIDILDTLHDINRTTKMSTYECVGFLDDNSSRWGHELHGVKILGPLESASNYSDCTFVNGIGSSRNFWRKQEIIAKTGVPAERFATVIHPTASVSTMATVGVGTVVFQNVTITSNVRIGNHVIILPGSIVSHDDVVGDYTSITGGVCISGGVQVGHSCYLGTNAAIADDIVIGNYCLIGMGSVVLDDVADNTVVVGNPARRLRDTMPTQDRSRLMS